VLEVACKEGDTVDKGQVLAVVEAMKMEASINAPSSGKLCSVEVSVGDAIREGQVVARYA
jgi:biotin carboxyl carrier protein